MTIGPLVPGESQSLPKPNGIPHIFKYIHHTSIFTTKRLYFHVRGNQGDQSFDFNPNTVSLVSTRVSLTRGDSLTLQLHGQTFQWLGSALIQAISLHFHFHFTKLTTVLYDSYTLIEQQHYFVAWQYVCHMVTTLSLYDFRNERAIQILFTKSFLWNKLDNIRYTFANPLLLSKS